jgi:hypothetical protein
MEAFEAWKTAFKVKVGTSLNAGLATRPVVTELNAIDINGSTVTVFVTYTDNSRTFIGSVQYIISDITGTTYQEKLDDISAKIAGTNIVTNSKEFYTVADTSKHLIADLAASTKLPDGGLKTAVQAGKTIIPITDFVTSIVHGSGYQNYAVVSLSQIGDKYYSMGYTVRNLDDSRTTDAIYADLANNTGTNKIQSIIQQIWTEYTQMADYFDIDGQYKAWCLEQSRAAVM